MYVFVEVAIEEGGESICVRVGVFDFLSLFFSGSLFFIFPLNGTRKNRRRHILTRARV